MSAELQISSKKRRREVSSHKPAKKPRYSPDLNDVEIPQMNEEHVQETPKRQKNKKLKVNGHKPVEEEKKPKLKKRARKEEKIKVEDKCEVQTSTPEAPQIPEPSKNEPSVEAKAEREVSVETKVEKTKVERKSKRKTTLDPSVAPQAIIKSSRQALVKTPKGQHEWSWSISQPLGGRFASLDPVFSLDEK
jgi:hypothetical protein